MIDGLHNSRASFNAALQDYLDVLSNAASKSTSQSIAKGITAELEFITSCSTKLKQARVMINRARNSYAAIVPINVLPFEIITRIFRLVLDVQPCYYHNFIPYHPENITLKPPESLSHVCSRWRQIALGSHQLWTHIDVIPFHSPSKFEGFLARGETFAARAGSLPLHIHMFEAGERGKVILVRLTLIRIHFALRYRQG